MARQAVLTRQPDPLRLSVVMDESTLYRVAGDQGVMADQLDHLAEMAELPNIDLRMLPLSAGVFSAAFGAFTIITAAGSADPYMVCVGDRTGFRYMESRGAVDTHLDLFDHLSAVALRSAASVDLIRTTAKETYR